MNPDEYEQNLELEQMILHLSRRLRTRPSKHLHRQAYIQLYILRLLQKEPEGLTARELSDRLTNSPSTTSELIQKLEKKGLISKKANPKDKRSWLIQISPAGEEKLRELCETNASDAFSVLTSAEKNELLSLIKKVWQYKTER